tara:strand:+ start:815 stop:1669 length:855 start_codon:yes stop_codon:yes gene_type:complete
MQVSELLKEELIQPKEMPKLSPSSINLYAQDPALWVLKHYYGSTGMFNIYAMRGVSIEEGVNEYFSLQSQGKCPAASLLDAVKLAQGDFTTKSFFWDDDEIVTDLEQKIAPWVLQSIGALEENFPNELPKMQTEIETEIEGMPIRGFMDYSFVVIDVDLKTCNTLPSIVSRGARKGMLPADKRANVRQQAIYSHATHGQDVALAYVTHDDYLIHELGEKELDEAMESVVALIKEMKELVSLPIEEVIERTVPKWKSMGYSFYWDANLTSLAEIIWSNYKEDEGY